MSVSQEVRSAALLGHIANQMQVDVAFLESQNFLSPQDAATMREIIGRLPVQTQINTTSQATAIQAPPPRGRAVPLAPIPAATAPSKGAAAYARAIWAYNEDGVEVNDISFAAGETIEILSEKNADWWLGKARGKEGLFPSNHVEKIASSAPAAPATAPRAYRPFGAALHGADTPPANGTGVNSLGLQQAAGQPEKKNRFGGLGNTMANSAAGGVGFGAGAAIGSGLVHAIF